MAIRNIVFAEDEVYHIFNRGVAKTNIFLSSKHYVRFLHLLEYYHYANTTLSYSSFSKLNVKLRSARFNELKQINNLDVSILSYCLMPNHFHILLKQKHGGGITRFMRHIQDGYAKYFNIVSNRVGPLYQSSFKAVRIESDEQLVHVSRYIHLNPTTAFLINEEKLHTYSWSSLLAYIGNDMNNPLFVDTEDILSFFKNKEDYKQFVYDQVSYQRELSMIKHLVFE